MIEDAVSLQCLARGIILAICTKSSKAAWRVLLYFQVWEYLAGKPTDSYDTNFDWEGLLTSSVDLSERLSGATEQPTDLLSEVDWVELGEALERLLNAAGTMDVESTME